MNRAAWFTRSLIFVCLFLLYSAMAVSAKDADPDRGVTHSLALMRQQQIRELHYDLRVSIPATKNVPIPAVLNITWLAPAKPSELVLDFTPGNEFIRTVQINGQIARWRFVNEHILVASDQLKSGKNQLQIDFIMGDMSLNRRDDLLYTLFVPDRARTALPCFDQPNIKGTFALTLDLPPDWNAVANGPLQKTEVLPDGRQRLQFAPSHPLPTYLMAFVAGKLQRVEATRQGRTVQIFHQEADQKSLDRNLPGIFDQVFSSLAWMERYTGLAYPFAKYDLIMVPSFQYGGMEHCGATLYRASHLLQEEDATLEQRLSRASLIAHETAHMWFGDLVTMPWFDEVWLKEVFAGFMADKMVEELFPTLDHRLKFLMGHTPAALAVDRSLGSHPITQELDNLSNAGTLYGNLIYHKAPIVMDQLERKVGKDRLQKTLGAYLKANAYGNAGWDPLIQLLDDAAGSLKKWSRAWVYEAGLPTISVRRDGAQVFIEQADDLAQKRTWSQRLSVVVKKGDMARALDFDLATPSQQLNLPSELQDPDLVLVGGDGIGYGRMLLDERSLQTLLKNPLCLSQARWRGAAWFALWEALLDHKIKPADLLATALNWIEREENVLVYERILSDLIPLYWRLLPPQQRLLAREDVETKLWQELFARPKERRMAVFDTCRRIVSSPLGLERLLGVLSRHETIDGVMLSEQKELDLLINLGVYSPVGFDELLQNLPLKWKSNHRRDQLQYLKPLFSVNAADWLAFFNEKLTRPEFREQEPWVLSALSLIHHPLRSERTEELIPKTLAMLPEIQQTGDIFFPIGWVGESLWGHQSARAAKLVRDFLNQDTTLSARLRQKVLQGADYLLRQNPEIDTISRVVEQMCSLPRPRNVKNPDMLTRAAGLISEDFCAQGWTVRSQDVPFAGGLAQNISVLWGEESVPRMVIGAHYDVCGDTPGADDNASGVAVLLELAGLLSKQKPTVGRAVELVAYALEEPPYFGTPQMGSYVHAQSLKRANCLVKLMISLDMVGYYSDADSVLAVIGREDDKEMLGRVCAVLAKQPLLNVKALPLPLDQKGIDWSDHRNFWAAGYPALMLHSSPFFQNPNYHRLGDQPQLLDYSRMKALAKALLGTVHSFIDFFL